MVCVRVVLSEYLDFSQVLSTVSSLFYALASEESSVRVRVVLEEYLDFSPLTCSIYATVSVAYYCIERVLRSRKRSAVTVRVCVF